MIIHVKDTVQDLFTFKIDIVITIKYHSGMMLSLLILII